MGVHEFETTSWINIKAAAEGDVEGLKYLAERYYLPLRAVLRGFLRRSGVSGFGETLVDDVLQGCFLKLLQDRTILSRTEQHHSTKFRRYLCAVCINMARNHLRKLRRRGVPGSGREHESLESITELGIEPFTVDRPEDARSTKRLPKTTKVVRATELLTDEDENAWAHGLIQVALVRLREELKDAGKEKSLAVLSMSIHGNQKPAQIAPLVGWNARQVSKDLFLTRRRLRAILMELVEDYSGKKMPLSEIRELFGL